MFGKKKKKEKKKTPNPFSFPFIERKNRKQLSQPPLLTFLEIKHLYPLEQKLNNFELDLVYLTVGSYWGHNGRNQFNKGQYGL